MDNIEYRIGDVAELVGVSRDALRFYEKKGVITARKKDNGYRYYSENDIYKLMYVLYYRKMNTSLEEIENLVSDGISRAHLRSRTRQRIAEEKTKMRRHQQAVTRLNLVARDLDSIEESLDCCRVKTFPKAYILGTCPSLLEGMKEWFRLASREVGLDMAYFYNIYAYSQENGLVQEGTQLLFYQGVEPFLDAPIDAREHPLTDPVNCVYSVVESTQIGPDLQTVERMARWARGQGLNPGTKVYANNMMSFFKGGFASYCLELYLVLE